MSSTKENRRARRSSAVFSKLLLRHLGGPNYATAAEALALQREP
jgi:hypothetical protein